MRKILLLTIFLAGLIFNWMCLAQTDLFTRVIRYPASIATNLPNYQENFVLTSNGDYIANADPARFWRHCVWEVMSNGWRIGLNAPQLNHPGRLDRPGFVDFFAGSPGTNSGPGYLVPPFNKFAKFELLSPDGKVMPIKPNAGITNMTKWGYWINYLADQTNVPFWSSPTNGSVVADFPETASPADFPHVGSGELVGNFRFFSYSSCSIATCQLGDLYSITNEGDYTLTAQAVLYKLDDAEDRPIYCFQTNLVLHRVDLPCITTKVHLLPNEK